MWRIEWAPSSIPIYVQQDETLHSLFISGNCSTCFGWYFYPSSGAHTTVSIVSDICHTVTATCRYRWRVGTGLSVLCVAYATHSTLKPVPTQYAALRAHNVLCNSYNTRPLLCARITCMYQLLCNSYNTRPLLCAHITCYLTVITPGRCYARA
jgi:hypothetical protein